MMEVQLSHVLQTLYLSRLNKLSGGYALVSYETDTVSAVEGDVQNSTSVLST